MPGHLCKAAVVLLACSGCCAAAGAGSSGLLRQSRRLAKAAKVTSSSLSSSTETPAPTEPKLDYYPIPGDIDAVGYNIYSDVFTGTGPRAGDGTVANVIAGEYAQYHVDVAKTANYQFTVVLKGTPPKAGVNLKMHFEPGATACPWSEELEYYPTISEEKWVGSKAFKPYTTKNNVMELEEGKQTITLCFDDASYIYLDYITVKKSDMEVQKPSTPSNALIFGSAWATLGIAVGAGMLVVLGMGIFWCMCVKPKLMHKAAPMPGSPAGGRAVKGGAVPSSPGKLHARKNSNPGGNSHIV